jgi:hypothetical protein
MSLEAGIFPDWLAFMREDHIPKIFATGCFSGYKICRIVDESSENFSVAVQYFAVDSAKFQQYMEQFSPSLQREYTAKFGTEAPAFRTVLHALEEGEVVPEFDPSQN